MIFLPNSLIFYIRRLEAAPLRQERYGQSMKENESKATKSEHRSGTFISSDGKTTASYEIYTPKTEGVRAVVQVSHGMCEYVGRYADFADCLCAHGIALAGNDHLGHGKSAATDDDLGFFGGNDGDRYHIVDDLHTMNGILREHFPDAPVILLGHSMGSFIARLFLTKYAEDVDAAIIMGTAGKGAPTGIAITLSNIIISMRGERHRSKLLKNLSFSGYLKRCGKGCAPNAWLTKDESIVNKYSADKYCTFTFTASAYRELFSMLEEVSSDEWAPMIPTDLPLLLISGEDDPVGGFGSGVREVAARLTAAGASDLTLKLFPGDRHEVLNETDRPEVYAYLLDWIEAHLPVKDEKGTQE